jgi:hypothetical protein
MAKKAAKKRAVRSKKPVRKDMVEAPVGSGADFNEQDPKRRIGHFEGAGEPPRKGSRTTGIGGQTKQKSRTDKKKK